LRLCGEIAVLISLPYFKQRKEELVVSMEPRSIKSGKFDGARITDPPDEPLISLISCPIKATESLAPKETPCLP